MKRILILSKLGRMKTCAVIEGQKSRFCYFFEDREILVRYCNNTSVHLKIVSISDYLHHNVYVRRSYVLVQEICCHVSSPTRTCYSTKLRNWYWSQMQNPPLYSQANRLRQQYITYCTPTVQTPSPSWCRALHNRPGPGSGKRGG